jgi:[CysO sulfur-carrier protein]-S-L-cysteine hydrolase
MLYLDKEYSDEMIAHARQEAPNECCGILAGKNGRVVKLFRTTNTLHSPTRYNVEPLELIRVYQELDKQGWQFFGIYHSHPHSEAYPSATDIQYAFFPRSWYFIVALGDPAHPRVRAFHIVGGKIEEEELIAGE